VVLHGSNSKLTILKTENSIGRDIFPALGVP
jgi:hypothetical protein